MRGLAATATAVVFLLLAPAAGAVQRFAAPAGSGSECTQPKPCLLTEAVVGAKAGDEVIVTPGTYTVGGPIFLPPFPNVQVHGEAGAPMPKIAAASGGPVFYMTQTGDSLSYMEIENDANGGTGVICVGSKIERVKATVIGTNAIGVITQSDCSIRNSLFRVEGIGSTALRGAGAGSGISSVSARGMTAIAAGSSSVGVSAEYNEGSPGEFIVQLQNSIVQGGEVDLKPQAGAKGPGNILAIHSNFDSSKPVGEAKVIDGGGNQTAAPLFVSAEAGDYHEAAGSPTIDAGSAGELGPFDLDGTARVLGSAPDIGAFESVPPPAGQIQSLSIKPKSFKAKTGATVSYSLSAAGTVEFRVERKTVGRKSGKKCLKKTRKNAGKKKCSLFKPVKGSIAQTGATGANSFKFNAKVGGKALKPGVYKLVGSAGGAIVRAPFQIVK